MANAEHLEILMSGVGKWNKWRTKNKGRRIDPDLSGADLSKMELNEVNFHNTNLSKSNLSETYFFNSDLSQSNMSDINLTGSTLFDCNLYFANLINANFSNADLALSNFSNADLFSANFENAELGGTIFGMTDLSDCNGLDSVTVVETCIIDFHTLRISKNIPKSFLLKIGLPELYIDYLPDFFTDTLKLFPAFLSHSKENREFARKLYEALIAKGVSVFFDEKRLKPGDSLVKVITKGINHYDKTIMVCSKESLKSTWVDYELELVLKKEQALMEQKEIDEVGLLIPITIDDHVFSWKGPKEWDIKTRFIGDFREWQDRPKYERALNELVQALNVKRLDIKPSSYL